jgi:putative ABC transport system substrate-binding protein
VFLQFERIEATMIGDRTEKWFHGIYNYPGKGRVPFWSRPRIGSVWLGRAKTFFIALLLLALPLPAAAQEKPLEIGVLALGPRNVPVWQCGEPDYRLASAELRRDTEPEYVVGLREELKRLKYVESQPGNAGTPGRRYSLDLRMGTLPELRSFARNFASKPVDVIVGIASLAVQIAKEETKGIPIIMTGISDPVGEGFVQSLARPGGVVTGVSHQLVQGSGKRVELFKEMLPGLRRLITIRRPGYGPSEKGLVETLAAADHLNIEVLAWGAGSREEIQMMLREAKWKSGDGFMILPDSLAISNTDLVLETSLQRRVPTFGHQDYTASWGALAAYGPSASEAGAHAARYIDKISKGAKPGELPVEPVDPTFVINLKTAECMGTSLPLEVLRQADRIIK